MKCYSFGCFLLRLVTAAESDIDMFCVALHHQMMTMESHRTSCMSKHDQEGFSRKRYERRHLESFLESVGQVGLFWSIHRDVVGNHQGADVRGSTLSWRRGYDRVLPLHGGTSATVSTGGFARSPLGNPPVRTVLRSCWLGRQSGGGLRESVDDVLAKEPDGGGGGHCYHEQQQGIFG